MNPTIYPLGLNLLSHWADNYHRSIDCWKNWCNKSSVFKSTSQIRDTHQEDILREPIQSVPRHHRYKFPLCN